MAQQIRDDLMNELIGIFDTAMERCDKLQRDRLSSARMGGESLEEGRAKCFEEKRAIRKEAFAQVVTRMNNLDAEYLPVFSAICFFSYGDERRKNTTHQKASKSSRERELRNIDKRTQERVKHAFTQEQNDLLLDYAEKNYAARRKGADVIHAESRSMKAEVFTWLESQAKFKSIEAAAMAITKQQPIAHVTGRAWYKEWKKLRSASTP